MSSLSETLLAPERRPAVVAALAADIDAEVASQRGIGGAAVKAAYATAKKVKDGIVDEGVDSLLPQLVRDLQPLWDERGERSFADQLTSNADQAVDIVLAAADARAAHASYPVVSKIYQGLRGKAKDYVVEALPRVGSTVEKFMA